MTRKRSDQRWHLAQPFVSLPLQAVCLVVCFFCFGGPEFAQAHPRPSRAKPNPKARFKAPPPKKAVRNAAPAKEGASSGESKNPPPKADFEAPPQNNAMPDAAPAKEGVSGEESKSLPPKADFEAPPQNNAMPDATPAKEGVAGGESNNLLPKADFEAPPPKNAMPNAMPDTAPAEEGISSEENKNLPMDAAQPETQRLTPLQGSRPPQTIRLIQVTGATLLAGDQMAEATNPFLGQELNLVVIERLAEAVTKAYQAKGFILAKAYFPEQEIRDGKITIAVLEGTISALSVTGNEYYPTPFIEKHFIGIGEPHGARLDLIKRSVLILNNYTDLTAKVFLKPGATPGTTQMQVQIKDYQPVHLALDYNNFGSRHVSRDRFGLDINIGNILSDGHLFSLRGVMGSPPRDMTFLRGGYAAPFGYRGHKVHFSYARGDFDVGREFEPLNIRMKTEAMNLSMTYPFLKTDLMGLTGEVGLAGNDFTQTTLGTLSNRDRIRVLGGGLDYNRAAENTRDFVLLRLSQGLGNLLTESTPAFASRPGADNQFTKGTVEAVRIRVVREPYWMFHPFSVILRGGIQVSSDNLVVGEQFVLGGPDSVRGYANGEFMGDHGYRVSSEWRISPLRNSKHLQVALFLDHGGSFIKTRKEDQYLTAVGFGLRFDFPKTLTLREPGPETPGYVLDSRFQLRADVGYPIDPRPSLSGKSPVYFIYAVGGF